ncbi:aminopeptidase N-like [Portunus trituberculatus]|uniref:aminopeptidase N-like n=1 Tax=Portunus trituberculatus TaxID=210409 RepID=UPI001E1CF673|nr:aminopeptidase N-like [Portunus trituberculatus]XP_045118112.1 aminopeptidase N-like [Portunus trituberculatus]
MLRWSAHPPGASCQPLLRLASAVVLLTAGNAVSVPVSPSLSSSSSALSFFSRGTSPRSTTAVWLPEHVLMYPALYKHKTQMHSHRNDLTAAANTVSIGGNDGGGEGKEAVVRDTTQRSNKEFRLPASLRPIHYSVRVQPFINGNYSVHGSVQIDIEVLQATSNITLHVYGMDIHTHGIQLQAAEGDEETASVPQITHFVDDLDVEIFTAHLDGVLEAGRRVRYTIPYEGTLAFYMGGFYGHRYTDVDGTDKHMVSTLSQPADARIAFPCFDEPQFKATFEVHVARQVNMTAVSNMPLLTTTSIEDQEGWVWDRFQTTPPMSTYLLILVVMSLPHINVTAHRQDLPIRVWARQEALDRMSFLHQFVPVLMDFMETYTNTSYSLPKLDIIVVPGKEGLAFEGWGAIIVYDEHFMLYDPLEDDEMDFARVTWVQAHELAHQWFGNLVTPRWWSDLWLSEGISSYMSDFAMQETAMVSQSVIEQARSAVHELFPEDDKVTAVPVFNQQIDVFSQDTYFNVFSYFKSSLLLRMMAHVLSHHAFRKGMVTFLHEHQYGSVVQDDLFRHLTKAAHEAYTLPQDLSVKTILDTWIHETGYPLVTVTRSPSGISATAYQEKYLWLQDDSLPIDHFSTWWVPLTYTTQDLPDFSDTRVKVWLKDTETQTPVHNLPPKDQWVIFNLQQTGYYRVNYDDHNWNLLIQQLLTDHQLIHVNNRVQMIDDILNLASSGKVSYKIALSLVEYMKNENETLPWRVFQRNMEHMKQILETTPAHEGFKKYMWSLLVPLWDLVGFEKITEVQTIQQKHSQAVKWACHYSLPSCVHLAASLYAQWMLTPENIKVVPRDLWGTVYCTAIAHGGEAEWDFAWQQYFLSNDTHHKEQLVAALSCSRDTWAENGYLDLALTSETKLRTQNTLQMFYSVASSSGGKPLAWNFLTRRWSALVSLYGDSGAAAEQLVVAAAETLTSQQDMEKLRVFRESHRDNPRVVAASKVALDIVARNVAWMEKNYDVICDWLHSRGFYVRLR